MSLAASTVDMCLARSPDSLQTAFAELADQLVVVLTSAAVSGSGSDATSASTCASVAHCDRVTLTDAARVEPDDVVDRADPSPK